jgi:hypothetical protein
MRAEEEERSCWGENACADGNRRATTTARTRARRRGGSLTDAMAAVYWGEAKLE